MEKGGVGREGGLIFRPPPHLFFFLFCGVYSYPVGLSHLISFMSKQARSASLSEDGDDAQPEAKKARVEVEPFPWLDMLEDVRGLIRGKLAYNDAYVLSRTCKAEADKFVMFGPQHVKAFLDTLMVGGSVAQAKWFSHVLRWSYHKNRETIPAVHTLYQRGCPDDPYYANNDRRCLHPVLRCVNLAIDHGHVDLLAYCKDDTTLMPPAWNRPIASRAATVSRPGVLRLLLERPSESQVMCIGLSGNRVAVEMFEYSCRDMVGALSRSATIRAVHTGDMDFLAFLRDKNLLRTEYANRALFHGTLAMPLAAHLDHARYDISYPPLMDMVPASELEANRRLVAAFLLANFDAAYWESAIAEGRTEEQITLMLDNPHNLADMRNPRIGGSACAQCGNWH